MLQTERLLLREWREEDREPFARINADPEVMEHFPAPLDRVHSDQLADRIQGHLDGRGWGLWAVEILGGARFIGFTGLTPVGFDLIQGREAIEVGWRLERAAWGHGYATEAATEALRYGFGVLDLDEVVSYAALTNHRSLAVMERLGMTRAEEFDHPRLPPGHPLRPHVVYRAVRPPPAASSSPPTADR
jgi:RimJ/RimL family protein N-acetyltransferase